MTIIYDALTGAYKDAMWADAGDAQSCLGKNLKDVSGDVENQCAD